MKLSLAIVECVEPTPETKTGYFFFGGVLEQPQFIKAPG